MNFSVVFNVLGRVLLCEGALMALPMFIGLYYGEYNSVTAFLMTIALCAVAGFLLCRIKTKNKVFYIKEGFVITSLSWIMISIFGAIPFYVTGTLTNPADALFETVSGFTTTGASVLADVEILSKSMLFWRSFTHWIGGMGVLVFLLMLTPVVGGSNANLMKAESPGPQVEKFVPKLQSTAKILYAIYICMTLIQFALLSASGMSFFDAAAITFGTAGTGGFGVLNDSVASYTSIQQTIIMIFMILFGINFSFYFLAMQHKMRKAFEFEEVHWYFIIIVISAAVITFNIYPMYKNAGRAIHTSLFQVASIITTTGFSSVDFDKWPQLSRTILVMLMFVGACAGSTGGGIKISRIVILFKTMCKEIHSFMHPQRIGKITLNKKPVAHETVRSINVFMVAYVAIFTVSILIISLDNFDFTTNFTAVATTLNDVGPGLSLVGPTENFAKFSVLSKFVLMFDMIAGRLEIFPLLLLLSPKTWKRF